MAVKPLSHLVPFYYFRTCTRRTSEWKVHNWKNEKQTYDETSLKNDIPFGGADRLGG